MAELAINTAALTKAYFNQVELSEIVFNGVSVYKSGFSFDYTFTNRQIDFVLTDWLLQNGWDGVVPVTGTVTIPLGLYCGGTVYLGETPAFDTGVLPAGSDLTLKVEGLIIGRSGPGGAATAFFASAGSRGGHALLVRSPIKLYLTGMIAAGGGGGGGVRDPISSGAIGAGYIPSDDVYSLIPEQSSEGNHGGGLGEPGFPGDEVGGPPGYAIKGLNLIEFLPGSLLNQIIGDRLP